MLQLNLDLFVSGLIVGLYYALMAVGLTMIFGILEIINFAHGEFYMIGAYTYTLVATALGVPAWLALIVALIAGGIIGWVTERLLMRPLYAAYTSWNFLRDEYAVVVTFGLSLLLINLAVRLVGPYAYRGPALWGAMRIAIGPVLLTGQQIVIVLLGIAVLAGVSLFVKFSLWGRQVQAVAQNRLGASLAGIDTAKASSIIFTLSGVLAALAGALLAPVINPTPDVGSFPAIKSYVIVVLGGMGSLPGSILGSLILGVLESFGAVYISYAYRDTYGLAILILVLWLRPQGLLGMKGRRV